MAVFPKRCFNLYYNTFCALIRAIIVDLGDTNVRESILVEASIDILLARLGIENSSKMCGKV